MSDTHVLAMPVRRFWAMSDNIDRINASNDIRAVRVNAATLSSESYKETMESYSGIIKDIYVADQSAKSKSARDEKAIAELKRDLMGF